MARRDLLFCLALLLATLAVYSQVAQFDFVNYDDPDYTTGNRHVRAGLTGAGVEWAFTSSYAANWFPLTWLSHMLDYQFFGSNAGWHHVTNLVLHVLNTLLLFALLRRMSNHSPASAFVAFVFALHPLHVESVAWIADRKDLLCTLFSFLTIFAYVRFIDRPGALRYVLMHVAFACALMSKSMAVTLPLVLLLLDYWPLRQLKTVSFSRLVFEKVPMMAMSIAAAIVTFLVQRSAGAVVDSVPLELRIENALVSYAVYVLKFFWPTNLAVFYPYAPIPLWQPIAAAVGLIAMTAFVIRQWTKRRYLAVGWFWYLITLIPAIGIVQVGVQVRADRYTYFPLIGLAIMLAWRFKGFVVERKWMGPPLALIAIAICIGGALLARRNVGYWRNSLLLFQRAVDVTEDNYVAYANLGWAQWQDGHGHEAIANFERSLSIKPHFGSAESGLGETLSADGRFEEAMPHVIESVRLEPNSATAHINLGAAYSRQGKMQEAADQYRTALALDPENEVAHCGLGVALVEQGRLQEALQQLLQATQLNPDYADGHYNLGRVYGLQGRPDEAMTEFREAIRVQPTNSEAHYNLATALAQRELFSQASDEFKAAVELKPDYVNARFGYASALAAMEKYGEAIPQFQALLRLKPDFKAAQEALAMAVYLIDHPEAKPSAHLETPSPNSQPRKEKKHKK
jgi:protein O-mannosyl-transferase